MPLGWYLAQGLVPLGPSSSDDEEGPCELPNGRLVCGPHGFVTCHKCCSDYSFMEEVLDEEEDDDDEDDGEDHQEADGVISLGRGDAAIRLPFATSGLAFQVPATAMNTQHVEPMDAQAEAMYWDLPPEIRDDIDRRHGPPPPRQISDAQAHAILNQLRGLPPDRFPEKNRGTGRAFPTKFFPPNSTIHPMQVFPIEATGFEGLLSGRLENEGPFGGRSAQTSNRAELRAVIAALRCEDWFRKGYHAIVLATDSGYVVEGATKHAKKWIRYGWTTREGTDVKNKDLWEMLLGDVERLDRQGTKVHFWRIPREWNEDADAAAKSAASLEAPAKWKDRSL
ncbi:hypothetical protein E8E14_006906 [Neopestalotiopsis sp. 37M]|nr:hypothetical protein E8E14_006906 [Neopestalotiopsis sp. 37M]